MTQSSYIVLKYQRINQVHPLPAYSDPRQFTALASVNQMQHSITWAWCLQDKSDYALGIDGELLVADIISRTRIAKKISNDVAHDGGDNMSFCELAGEDKNLVTDSDQQKILNMIREACPEDRDTLVRIIECLAEDIQ